MASTSHLDSRSSVIWMRISQHQGIQNDSKARLTSPTLPKTPHLPESCFLVIHFMTGRRRSGLPRIRSVFPARFDGSYCCTGGGPTRRVCLFCNKASLAGLPALDRHSLDGQTRQLVQASSKRKKASCGERERATVIFRAASRVEFDDGLGAAVQDTAKWTRRAEKGC